MAILEALDAILAASNPLPLLTTAHPVVNTLPTHSSLDASRISQQSASPDAAPRSIDRYYRSLDKRRAHANTDSEYSSADTRKRMTEEVRQRTEGKTLYDWQLDIAEAFYLGVESVIIAGTGAGKTLPFTMALLADSSGKSKIMIISTLNELERDQVSIIYPAISSYLQLSVTGETIQ